MIRRRISEFLMISVLLPMISIHAENAETVFHLSLKEPVNGMVYALYEDEACEKPLQNTKGEDVILKTDQEGKAEASVTSQKFYLKQKETVPGWYQEKDAVMVTEDSLELQPHPVSWKFSEQAGGKDISSHLQLLNEKKEVIADWKTEKPSEPTYRDQKVLLEAGKSYVLRNPDVRQWETSGSVTVNIPAYYDPDLEEITNIERRSYGRAVLKTQDTEKKTVSGASLKLFEDEKGTVQATDVQGKQEILRTDRNGTVKTDLYPGTYYAQIQNPDPSYYMDDTLWPVQVKAYQSERTEITLKPVLVSVSMKDPDGKKVEGVMILNGDGKEIRTSSEILRLKRDKDYVLRDAGHPAGYHGAHEVSFHTPVNGNETIEQSLVVEPFQVHGKIMNHKTGEIIRGGTFQLLNPDGKEVLRFTNGELHTSDLAEGTVYTIHCLSLPKGYQIPADQRFETGLEGNPSFEVSCVPYVRFTVRAISTGDQKPLNDVKWSLYSDQACTQILKDIHGNEMREISGEAEISGGTFYGKVRTDNPHYYQDDQVYEIHAEGMEHVMNATLTKADLRIQVMNPKQDLIRHTEISVLDSSGNSIGQMISSGDDLLSSLKLQKEPVPGDVLYLEIRKTQGLYTWKDRRTRVQIPLEKPAEMPVVQLNMNPYVSLDVSEASEKEKTPGSTYALFEEEDCIHKAMDIHGKETEAITDQDGQIHWDMRSGTYWLKEVGTEASAYLNETPVKVILDPMESWHEQQNFATVKPVVHFATVDTQGNPVRGGSYEIQDETGTVVHTFQAGGTVALKGKWLKPGKTILIHEVSPASGYQKHETDIRYTLPKAIPDKTPEIRIHCLRNAYSSGQNTTAKTIRQKVKSGRNSSLWLIPVAVAGGALVLIVLKIVSKKNENRYKKI